MTNYTLSLPRESLQRIHETALRILAEVGIHVAHAGMRDRLYAAGCRIEGERAFIPPDLVAATLRRIPSAFTLYGRSTEHSVTVGLNATHCMNTGIVANVVDLETGRVRASTLSDVQATTRLLDAMEHVDLVYCSLVDATDAAQHMVTVTGFAATVANTTKPLVGPGLTSAAEARAVVDIARAVRGGSPGRLRECPLCAPFICPVSPLTFPRDVVDALIVVAEAGLPLDIVTNPVMGLTAPYTIAGTVALGHAEVLASAVMASSITPGLPILNQNTPSVADMRSLVSTVGGPETGLIRRTVIELSHYLGIPGCAHSHTSSCSPDYQAGDEKALNTLLIASARPSLLGGLGALANVTLASYEMILLDAERYGAIRRILEGIAVDEDRLAMEAIVDLVAQGNAIDSEHTLRYLRSREVWRPALAIRQGLVDGQMPADSSVMRARAEAKRLLGAHQVEPLPSHVEAEIAQALSTYDQHARQGRN